MIASIKNRMNIFALLTVALIVGLYLMDNGSIDSRLPQIGYMLVRLTSAGFIAYHLSRFIFKDVRPDDLKTEQGYNYMLFRALTVMGALIGAGMAV